MKHWVWNCWEKRWRNHTHLQREQNMYSDYFLHSVIPSLFGGCSINFRAFSHFCQGLQFAVPRNWCVPFISKPLYQSGSLENTLACFLYYYCFGECLFTTLLEDQALLRTAYYSCFIWLQPSSEKTSCGWDNSKCDSSPEFALRHVQSCLSPLARWKWWRSDQVSCLRNILVKLPSFSLWGIQHLWSITDYGLYMDFWKTWGYFIFFEGELVMW